MCLRNSLPTEERGLSNSGGQENSLQPKFSSLKDRKVFLNQEREGTEMNRKKKTENEMLKGRWSAEILSNLFSLIILRLKTFCFDFWPLLGFYFTEFKITWSNLSLRDLYRNIGKYINRYLIKMERRIVLKHMKR